MKKKVLILGGGISKERLISLETARAVYKALIKKNYKVIICEPDGNLTNKIKSFKPNIVFNALHGQFGEDGYIQTVLESQKVKYTHSGVLASSVAMDKEISKKIFIKKKILTPKYIKFNFSKSNKIDKKDLLLNHIITLTYQHGSTKDCTPFIEINNFSKEFLNDYLNDEYYFKKGNDQLNSLQNSQMLDINHVSLPRNLKCCDRLSMANGVEARVPFLDHKLANYLFNLDNKYKFKNNQTRWIFKSLFKREISRYFSKKKNSVPDPQALWLKSDLKIWMPVWCAVLVVLDWKWRLS